MAQDIELILLRQWASYLTMPIFLCDHDGHLLFYNEAAELLLGRRYDEAGEMPVSELATIFETKREDGTELNAEEVSPPKLHHGEPRRGQFKHKLALHFQVVLDFLIHFPENLVCKLSLHAATPRS